MANPEDLEELSIYRDPDTGRFIGYDPQSSVSYAIPVDKLEGQEVTAGFAGEQHDVPQVRELTVADFESGTLDTDVWGGDVGNFTVQSTTKKDGSYALKANSENNIHSFDGLDAYPQRGDTFETSVYITAQDQQAWITWFLQNNSFNSSVDPNNATAIKLNTNSNIRLFHRRDGTRIISEFGVDSNNYLDEWLTFRVELLENGDTKATVFDSTDTELGTASISPDNPYDSGGISFSTFETTPAYWDTWTLKRRSPEYFTDTQKGTTELGNEVTPSGAIHTGPQSAPRNAARAEYANAPVNSDATQGAISKLTMLRSGSTPAAYMERTMDGQGGAYGHQMQAALGRFSRKNAQLDWGFKSFGDVPNWDLVSDGSGVYSASITGDPQRLRLDFNGDDTGTQYGGLISPIIVSRDSLSGFQMTFHDVAGEMANGEFRIGLTANSTDTDTLSDMTGLRFNSPTADATQLYVDGNQEGKTNYNGDAGNGEWIFFDEEGDTGDITIRVSDDGVELILQGNVVLQTSSTPTRKAYKPFIQWEDSDFQGTNGFVAPLNITVEPIPEVLQ